MLKKEGQLFKVSAEWFKYKLKSNALNNKSWWLQPIYNNIVYKSKIKIDIKQKNKKAPNLYFFNKETS